jgi:hypothetical protein
LSSLSKRLAAALDDADGPVLALPSDPGPSGLARPGATLRVARTWLLIMGDRLEVQIEHPASEQGAMRLEQQAAPDNGMAICLT